VIGKQQEIGDAFVEEQYQQKEQHIEADYSKKTVSENLLFIGFVLNKPKERRFHSEGEKHHQKGGKSV
jgi:hypothetical protein